MKTSLVLLTAIITLSVASVGVSASVSGSNTGNVPIPDAGGYVSSTIAISGAPAGAVVTGIDVYFKCTHPYSNDLTVDLNADSTGSLGNYRLWNREGGSAANPTRTTTGISTFNGLSVNRIWYLYAKDWAAGDTGYIDEWTITIYYTTPASPPSISGVTPNPITADAGNAYQTLTINGANFVNKPTLILTWTGQSGYTLPASQVTFVNSSQLTMSIHLGAAADNWTVKAVNPDNQSSSAVGFVVNAPVAPAPSISGVIPNPITADAGNAYQTLTINGANFVNKPTLILTWTGQSGYTLPASQVTFVNGSQLTMSIHLGAAADNWTVKAVNPDNQSSSAIGFVVNAPVAPAPSISGVTPNPITADAGNAYQTLTINGANFVNKPTLILTWTGQSGYTLPASQVTFVNSSQLTMSIHLGAAADNWTVKAVNPDNQSSSAVGFVVNAPVAPAPSISGVTPNPIGANAANSYQTLTINGANFVSKPTLILTWTGQTGYTLPASQVTFVNSSQLTMSIHLGAAADNWTVKAVNPDNQSSSAVGFVVNAPATQPILSITPASPPIQPSSAGSINLSLNNSGSGTMTYSASVTSGSSWLSITSGGAGGNSGTIGLSYAANTGSQRAGTIVVTATGASGSPATITVNQSASGGTTVLLPGAISYIRQINNSDLAPNFDSANACGPCSAVMLLTYYNRLSPHPMVGKAGHNNDYSWFVAPIDQSGVPSSTAYSYEGFTFDVGTPDVAGGTINYGAFGYLAQDFQSDPQTRADRAAQYFWKHGLWATFENAASESEVRAEIDAGRPVFLSARFSTGGHIMVIRGYDAFHLIAADPWIRPDGLDRNLYAYTWDELHFGNDQKWIIKGISPINDSARVSATTAFNVRQQPSLSATTAGPMRTVGEIGSVVLDSSKNSTFWNADGFTWIKVRWDNDNTLGWSAVGSGATPWIEPVIAPTTKTIALSGSLLFGSVAVGTSANLLLSLANNGTSPLAISSVNYPAGFTGNWNSGTIDPNRSVNIRVTFTPTGAVPYGGSINVNSDATGGTGSIAVSGSGANTQPTTYIVTPNAGANGNIDPSTIQTVNSSGAISFVASPASGYVIDKWLVNNVVAQTSSVDFTMTNVFAAADVQVIFKSLSPIPQLTGFAFDDGIVQFILNGQAGSNYAIQVSSNLVEWVPLSTNNIPASGSVFIIDSATPTQPRRFYRAVPVEVQTP